MKVGVGLLIILLSLLRPLSAGADALPNLKIVTEYWSPFQYTEMGQLKGISVDLLDEVLKRAGSSQTREDFVVLPWIRAYQLAQTTPNTLLFSVTRTPEREALFRWVGPIFENATYLIARKDRRIRINDPKDLLRYRFGTIREDASEVFLRRHGINEDQFTRNAKTVTNLSMLNAGRVDMVVCGWDALLEDAEIAGLDPGQFEIVYEIDSSEVSYALHLDTPDSIVTALQDALDELKAEGTYQQIWKKYKGLKAKPVYSRD